ncbi:hypothetical protein [Prosthecobacter vanneervenii]|uniref:Uncharacterized protein n=1 Tax=Prosthecobacter vanneervenii TaxID=48466 RepID=A0A7W8DMT5_9BACT|nr:hypothetical protein [Prosthecobacter vanneervenii]MBB5035612.1 hypothetical protein [Prosthecobacter vanneervenii]
MTSKTASAVILALSSFVLCASGQPAAKDAKADLSKKYPSLHIQAKVGKRNAPYQGSTYMMTMTMTPEVVIESARTQPMASASATFLLVTSDTSAKYRRGEEQLVIATSETLGIPAVSKGSRRSIEFKPLSTRYDSDRDETNVGGQEYKYFIMAVFSDDNQFLHIETNCAELSRHLQAHPDLRVQFLGMKPGAKFTTNFK